MTASAPRSGQWAATACILCECNCGIEIQLGGEDGRRFTRVRGDKAHPASQGYACEKPSRLDHYQNGRDRVTQPLRRRPDERTATGVAPNELTSSEDRDWLAGTPWHKHVPVRIEAL
jgi:anaerobic selenocysteine-containing dehydrogenase